MIQTVMTLLVPMSAITIFLVNKLKPIIKIPSNILVCIVSLGVGVGEGVYYLLQNGLPLDLKSIVLIVFVAVANFAGATYGYDKIKQTLEQIGEINE